ncbi:MAG: carboxypeptidase-like regulatory domain-containing protein, partial [Planctomycetota bacterium]|nr:carboxypeptidase-like regulatory domain-containing protein [Planctomycetota bacterium]
VTLDGAPLAGATVLFFPEVGPFASARTDDKGEYTLNAIVGKCKVTVSKIKRESATEAEEVEGEVVAADVAVEIDEGGEVSSFVPVIYGSLETTPLTVTVEENEDEPNDGNLDLSSS